MATTTPAPARTQDEIQAELADVQNELRQPPRRGERPADRTRLLWRQQLLELESLRLYHASRSEKRDAAQAEFSSAADEVERLEAAMRETDYGRLFLAARDAKYRMADAQAASRDLSSEVGQLLSRVYDLDHAQSMTAKRIEQLESE